MTQVIRFSLFTEKVTFFTCSSSVELYFNGRKTLPDFWAPGQIGHVSLPSEPSYIVGIHLHGDEYTPLSAQARAACGLILSLEQHTPKEQFFGTDSSWRCVPELPTGSVGSDNGGHPAWFDKRFDDQHWSKAVVRGTNREHTWKVLPGVRSEAEWIWAESDAQEVYCRGVISAVPGTKAAR